MFTIRKISLRALSIVCAVVLTAVFAACGDGGGSEGNLTGNRAVSVTIECESNFVFSKYDLDIYVDNVHQGSQDHGSSKIYEVNLDDGDHVLRITEKGNDSVDGSVDFAVNGNTSLAYKIKCTSSQVEIEAVNMLNPPVSSTEVSSMYHDEAHQAFEDAGFTNIKEEELRDLAPDERGRNWLTSGITIGGDGDFSGGDSYSTDAEVIITYHVLADLNPPASSEELEGMNYDEAVELFENAGFINVTTSTTSASGTIGTVSSVRIGGLFGSSDFEEGDAFPFDGGVEITYFEGSSTSGEPLQDSTKEVPEADLNSLLSSSDTNASWFSASYRGREITFDGWVADMTNHEGYDTRFDVLILAGDNGASPMTGPNFRLTDVNIYDMNVTNSDTLRKGDNVTITAIVGEYNSSSDWLELDPVSMSIR